MRLTLRGKIVFGLIGFMLIAWILTTGITGFADKRDAEKNYIIYTVQQSDTIWSIACEHTSENKDVRKTQYEILKINNINPDDLYPGMEIAILKK